MWNIRKPLARQSARGLTLVEMLMATALTLIMFAAVAQIFGMMGGAMQDARATIELSGNLRSVANHLQQDLDNLTVEVKPWVQPGSNQGYFEIIEGPDRDVDFAAVDVIDNTEYPDSGQNGSVAGDADDILCFTAYSKDEPFVGLIQGELKEMPPSSPLPHKFWIDRTVSGFTTITSQYAEIVYFTKLTDADDRNLYTGNTDGLRDAHETVTLYRRVFLIRPDIYFGLGSATSEYPSHDVSYDLARNDYDLSMSATSNTSWQTNSLEDLQLRQRRMARRTTTIASGFPFPLLPHQLKSFEQLNTDLAGSSTRDRTGEDVILTRVLAFDVKVFDPAAVIRHESGTGTLAVQPGDRDYNNNSNAFVTVTSSNLSEMMTGAFVDLNWMANARATPPNFTGAPSPFFGGTPASRSGLSGISADDALLFGTDPGDFNALIAAYPQMPSRLMPAGSSTHSDALTYSYYDTWPFSYEMDGVDQDHDGIFDEGTNGFDDNGNGIVDDLDEYETSPPYPVPLRGISVTVRAIEDGSRQVRQDTIMADFLPK